MTRRRVTVLPQFFDRLDQLLPDERSASGEPSTADFMLHDLTAIIDTLAEDYEGTMIPAPDTRTRIMVTAGMTVPFVAVYADLRPDDTVEVISLDLER
ncbi:MAG: hypothetical protein RIB98_08995 [Acidimicrobiales bacterium]